MQSRRPDIIPLKIKRSDPLGQFEGSEYDAGGLSILRHINFGW
jgi:hypothetical protein